MHHIAGSWGGLLDDPHNPRLCAGGGAGGELQRELRWGKKQPRDTTAGAAHLCGWHSPALYGGSHFQTQPSPRWYDTLKDLKCDILKVIWSFWLRSCALDTVPVWKNCKVIMCNLSFLVKGMRYKRRGVDADGHVANYVETEQLIHVHSHTLSFVQTRGSVPVFWSQAGYRYNPRPRLEKGMVWMSSHEAQLEAI